jgi:hypothetical protein
MSLAAKRTARIAFGLSSYRECDAAAAFRAHHLVVRGEVCRVLQGKIAKISHKKQIFLRDPQNFLVSCHFSRRRGDCMGRVFES